ncbi:MAG: hypothetical protein HN561_05685 [Candidatus Scalindua sp.]|nr:hypothetical protein [Candidatus Scalindua sp.]MBT7590545.1 hypothetical protein [Candidatus Scalindua sp.]
MKYKGTNFCQVHNNAIEKLNKTESKIPYTTRWLYIHLNLLEHRFTGKKMDFFFRSIKDLQADMQMGRKQIIAGIKILKELGLIETWQMHWEGIETKKLSRKHITAFRVLDI